MKVAALGVSLAGALVLGACTVTVPHVVPQQDHHHGHHHGHMHHDHHHHHAPAKPMQQTRRFSCQNGLYVNIHRLDNDRIELRLDDKRAVLTAAVSGSGERYVGNKGLFGTGAEWHQKGDSGQFSFNDPYGNAVSTSCRAVN